jgi:ankyrin repeat protein
MSVLDILFSRKSKPFGNSPLLKLADEEIGDVVRELLAARQRERKVIEQFAIWWASKNGHVKLVKLLLSDPRCEPSRNKQASICAACEQGHLEVVQLLLAHRRVVPPQAAMDGASKNGLVEVVKLLLKTFPWLDPTLALVEASASGQIAVAKILLADERTDPNRALFVAVRNNQLEIVQLLLTDRRVAAPYSALGDAVEYNQIDVLKLLLLDQRITDVSSALAGAVQRDHVECVELLLADTRADPLHNNQAPLSIAISSRSFGALRLLLADGRVDPSVNDQHFIREALGSRRFWSSDTHLDSIVVLLSDPRVVVPTDLLKPDRPILTALMLLRRSFRQNLSQDSNRTPQFQSLITEIESVESQRQSLLGAHLIPDLVGICLDYVPDLFSNYIPVPIDRRSRSWNPSNFHMDLSEAPLFISFASLSTM